MSELNRPKVETPPVPYKNLAFLERREGRPIRILAEFLHPHAEFERERVHDTIVFFGSARITEDGPLARYYQEARQLARMLAEWSDSLVNAKRRFVICTGGGPGIMEAANRGAAEAGSKTIGLNIGLPLEQAPNPYVTPELCFNFRYFFMRKFWFAYLAKALVVFPGGFGTMDELFELLTLVQTHKIEKKMVLLLYGSAFWKEIINFDALVRYGMISPEDLHLFEWADDPETAFLILKDGLTRYYLEVTGAPGAPEEETPAIARSRV
jgi:uncharacterized protein (TIGR00730 family)